MSKRKIDNIVINCTTGYGDIDFSKDNNKNGLSFYTIPKYLGL